MPPPQMIVVVSIAGVYAVGRAAGQARACRSAVRAERRMPLSRSSGAPSLIT
jgi:hypothetical protein